MFVLEYMQLILFQIDMCFILRKTFNKISVDTETLYLLRILSLYYFPNTLKAVDCLSENRERLTRNL